MIPCDHVGVAHPRDATLRADVGGHALQRHHRDGAGVLGDLRLLGRDHIHDHAALEHLGHPPLHARGAQLGGGGRDLVERHGVSLSALGVGPPMVRQAGRADPVASSRERTQPPRAGRSPRRGLRDLEVGGRRGRAREAQPPHEPARAQVEGVADGVVVHAPGDQDGLLDVRELGGEPGGQRVAVEPASRRVSVFSAASQRSRPAPGTRRAARHASRASRARRPAAARLRAWTSRAVPRRRAVGPRRRAGEPRRARRPPAARWRRGGPARPRGPRGRRPSGGAAGPAVRPGPRRSR